MYDVSSIRCKCFMLLLVGCNSIAGVAIRSKNVLAIGVNVEIQFDACGLFQILGQCNQALDLWGITSTLATICLSTRLSR